MAKSKYYEESELVKKARKAVDDQLSRKPGAYESAWQPVVEEALGKLQNRREFSYDPTGDALYRQYQDQYLRGGRQAMADTAARAAAGTGGYGNSYAAVAAQQSYGDYMAKLTDKIPALYALALDRYKQEGDALQRDYDLAAAQEKENYGRWQDGLSDWEAEYSRLLSAYTDARDYDRLLSRDAAADDKWEKEFAEDQRQFAVRYEQPEVPASSGSYRAAKKEEESAKSVSAYDALSVWCREQYLAGAGTDRIRSRVRQAYLSGDITKTQMQTLTGRYTPSTSAAASTGKESASRLLANYVR